MDFESVASEEAMKKNRCFVCHNYLSYFPIYTSGEKNICSRCYDPSSQKSNFIENGAYESVAQYVQFPCRYKQEGCIEKFVPKDIVGHEKVCPFRIIKCPTLEFTQCTWEGGLPRSLNHCQDKHFDIMLQKGEFEVDLSHSRNCHNLMQYDSKLFIISHNFYSINKCLEFSVCHMENATDKRSFSCEISFKNAKRNLIVQTEVKAHDAKEVIEVSLDSSKECGSETNIIIATVCLEQTNEGVKPIIDEKINQELLAHLKCTNCGHYAMPPIYQNLSAREGKQIICYECKENNSFYRTSNSLKRNFNLDNIANLFNFPCVNEKNGCNVIFKPAEMKCHQPVCLYDTYKCPLDCSWSGFGKDVAVHIETSHQDILISNATEISECLNNVLSTNKTSDGRKFSHFNNHILKFSNKLFRLRLSTAEDNFFWAVQLIGDLQDNYMFDLELVDATDTGEKLIVRRRCEQFTENVLTDSCSFNRNQIHSFISDEQIVKFKITVFK